MGFSTINAAGRTVDKKTCIPRVVRAPPLHRARRLVSTNGKGRAEGKQPTRLPGRPVLDGVAVCGRRGDPRQQIVRSFTIVTNQTQPASGEPSQPNAGDPARRGMVDLVGRGTHEPDRLKTLLDSLRGRDGRVPVQQAGWEVKNNDASLIEPVAA